MTLFNQIKEIKEYSKNHDLQECADKFKVSKPHMSRFCNIHRIYPIRRYCGGASESELKELVEKYSIEEICEKLNVSEERLKHSLYYLGILSNKDRRKRHPYGIRADRNEMIVYLSKKFTYSSIAEVFNVSTQRINEIVNSYDKENKNE